VLGVDLARMHIKYNRPAFIEGGIAHASNEPVWKKPQVPAAEKAHRPAEDPYRGDRELRNRACRSLQAVGPEAIGFKTAGLMRCWKDRGVVAVTRLDEFLEEPRRLLSDGECRRAKAAHRMAGHILKQLSSRPGILIKPLGRHFVGQPVEITVRGNLVSRGDGLADQVRKPFCEVTNDEASGRAAGRGQEFKQGSQVPLDPAFKPVPFRRGRLEPGPRQIEPIFDVY
jgi:hypothetical protein